MALAALVVAVSGCGSAPTSAPVEVRPPNAVLAPGAEVPPPVAGPASAPADTRGPFAEFEGKPGYYTVRPSDTLIRIGLDTGQSWRDIARWNNIENPNLIEVGQVLRVVAPTVDPTVVAARPIAVPKVDTRPLDTRVTSTPLPPGGASAAGVAGAASAAPPAAVPPPAAPAVARDADEDVQWGWPALGPVLVSFDETRNNKGLIIGGKLGDPVLAAADGRVVYAGAGLRGYGNLVIVKHNSTFLTAYAHNQSLLVKEDQPVRRGQKIAEMGSNEDRVQLHFEIRRLGKPIDPSKLLPPR